MNTTDAAASQPIDTPNAGRAPLRQLITECLQHYFAQLDGEAPSNLYELVRKEMEVPLLKQVMQFVGGNQSKAAEVLGINRGTLRKKLKQYHLE